MKHKTKFWPTVVYSLVAFIAVQQAHGQTFPSYFSCSTPNGKISITSTNGTPLAFRLERAINGKPVETVESSETQLLHDWESDGIGGHTEHYSFFIGKGNYSFEIVDYGTYYSASVWTPVHSTKPLTCNQNSIEFDIAKLKKVVTNYQNIQ